MTYEQAMTEWLKFTLAPTGHDGAQIGAAEVARFLMRIAATGSRWNQIDTCPANVAVLLYAAGYVVGHYSTTYLRWCSYTDGDGTAAEVAMNTWNKPTHWMPLHEPPEVTP